MDFGQMVPIPANITTTVVVGKPASAPDALLRISWPNADHEVLRHTAINANDPANVFKIEVSNRDSGAVLVPNGPVTVVEKKGRIDYLIPNGVTRLRVQVSISPSYEVRQVSGNALVPAVPARTSQHVVWSAKLYLHRDGNNWFQHDGIADGSPGDGVRHPLTGETININAQVGGAPGSELPLKVDFVDVTDLYKDLAVSDSIAFFSSRSTKQITDNTFPKIEVNSVADPWNAARILAYTASQNPNDPFLLFVLISQGASQQSADGIQCLTYYRPKDNMYNSLEQVNDIYHNNQVSLHNFYSLNRYLLSTDKELVNSGENHHSWPFFHQIGSEVYLTLNVGLAESLQVSQKRLVFFFPIPSINHYGAFISASHQQLLEKALLLLWVNKRLATGNLATKPSVDKLAMAGASEGGNAMRMAFQANQFQVTEVYGFDPNGIDALVGIIQHWLPGNNDKRFGLAAGFKNVDEPRVHAIESNLTSVKTANAGKSCGNYFIHPRTNNYWGPGPGNNNVFLGMVWRNAVDPSQNRFNYSSHPAVAETQEPCRLNPSARTTLFTPIHGNTFENVAHQFAIFGGETLMGFHGVASMSTDPRMTYMAFFLSHVSTFS